MAKEYIERKNTIRDLEKLCVDGKMIGNDNSTYIDFADAIEVVAEQPTADVQEVIRCKDCVYYVAEYCTRDIKGRTNMFYITADDFCSYGERKCGDGNG